MAEITKTHRTQAEIAAAHAKAADDLMQALHPGTSRMAEETLEAVGPEGYYDNFARADLPLLQKMLNNRLERLGVAA